MKNTNKILFIGTMVLSLFGGGQTSLAYSNAEIVSCAASMASQGYSPSQIVATAVSYGVPAAQMISVFPSYAGTITAAYPAVMPAPTYSVPSPPVGYNYNPPSPPPPSPPPPTDAQITNFVLNQPKENIVAAMQQYGVSTERIAQAMQAQGMSMATVAQIGLANGMSVSDAVKMFPGNSDAKAAVSVGAAVISIQNNTKSGTPIIDAVTQLINDGVSAETINKMLAQNEKVDPATEVKVNSAYVAAQITKNGTPEQKANAESIVKNIAGGMSVKDALVDAMFNKNISLEDLMPTGVSNEYITAAKDAYTQARTETINTYVTDAKKSGMSDEDIMHQAVYNGVPLTELCAATACTPAMTTSYNKALADDVTNVYNMYIEQGKTRDEAAAATAALAKNRGITPEDIAKAFGFTDASKVGSFNVTDIFNKLTDTEKQTAKQFFNQSQKDLAANAATTLTIKDRQTDAANGISVVTFGSDKYILKNNGDGTQSTVMPDGTPALISANANGEWVLTVKGGASITFAELKAKNPTTPFTWTIPRADGSLDKVDFRAGGMIHDEAYYNTVGAVSVALQNALDAIGTSMDKVVATLPAKGESGLPMTIAITDPALQAALGGTTTAIWNGTSFEFTTVYGGKNIPSILTPQPGGGWKAGCTNLQNWEHEAAPVLKTIGLPSFEDDGSVVVNHPNPNKFVSTGSKPCEVMGTCSTPPPPSGGTQPSSSGGGGWTIVSATSNRAPTCTVQLSGINSQGNEFAMPSSASWYSTPVVLATAVCSDPDTAAARKCAGDSFKIYDTKGTFSDTLEVMDMSGLRGTCSFTAHTDDQAPTLALSAKSSSYIKDLGNGLSAVTFPANTSNIYDFLVEFDDKNGATPVAGITTSEVKINYADGSTETTTLEQVDNGAVGEIPSGEVSHTAGYIRLKKSGQTFVAVTVTDGAGNATVKNFSLNIDTTPQVRLDKAGWKDYRTETVALAPQEISSSTVDSAYHRFEFQNAQYNNIITAARVTPSYIYTLINSTGSQVWQKTVAGDGNMSFGNGTNGTVDMSKLPDGQYALMTQYTDNILGSSIIAEVPVFVDNTNAPNLGLGLTTPDAPQVAGTNPMGTQYCDAAGVANEKRANGKRFINCIPAIDFSNFDTGNGKRDTYAIIFKKLFGINDNTPVAAEDQDMPIVVSGPINGVNAKLGSLDITADHIIDPNDINNHKTAGESTSTVRTALVNSNVIEARTDLFKKEIETPLSAKGALKTINGAELPMVKEVKSSAEKMAEVAPITPNLAVQHYSYGGTNYVFTGNNAQLDALNAKIATKAEATAPNGSTRLVISTTDSVATNSSVLTQSILNDDNMKSVCTGQKGNYYGNGVCMQTLEGGYKRFKFDITTDASNIRVSWSLTCNSGFAANGDVCAKQQVAAEQTESVTQPTSNDNNFFTSPLD